MDKLVLETLEERGSLETFEFAKELGKDHQAIVGNVKSIHALGDVSERTVHISVCYLQWGKRIVYFSKAILI